MDSGVASYYLQSYLAGVKARPELDARIDALTAHYRQFLPTRDELKRIADDFGSVDFAALFFADRVLSGDCNRTLNAAFARHLAQAQHMDASVTSRYRVLFVPGWDYVDAGNLTGANLAKPRMLASQFGLENELVAIAPHGTVEANADVVAAAIRKHAPSGKRLILVGASTGGPAIHLALAERLAKEDLASVKAWLNLAGILQGTAFIDWLQGPPFGWFVHRIAARRGWTEALASIGTVRSRERFARLRIDADILVINYLGIPVSGSLTEHSVDHYHLLREHGPNDGLGLLPDALAPNAVTIVGLGRDHFLAEDPQIDAKTRAFMSLIVAALESGRRCDP